MGIPTTMSPTIPTTMSPTPVPTAVPVPSPTTAQSSGSGGKKQAMPLFIIAIIVIAVVSFVCAGAFAAYQFTARGSSAGHKDPYLQRSEDEPLQVVIPSASPAITYKAPEPDQQVVSENVIEVDVAEEKAVEHNAEEKNAQPEPMPEPPELSPFDAMCGSSTDTC